MFSFPTVVNEKAARVVAAGVLLLALATALTTSGVLAVFLALGFAARVASGPRFSPLGLLASRVIAPRLGPPRLVPGPPKRFAQTVGLAFSGSAAIAAVGFGAWGFARGLLVVLALFAALEALLGFCAGCWVFGRLMAWGLVPEAICVECSDISRRPVADQASVAA